jgi:hypothetical protein
MMRGLLDLKRATHLVYVQTIDSQGNFVDVQPELSKHHRAREPGVDQHFRRRGRRLAPLRRHFDERSGQRAADAREPAPQGSGTARRTRATSTTAWADPSTTFPIHRMRGWDEAKVRRSSADAWCWSEACAVRRPLAAADEAAAGGSRAARQAPEGDPQEYTQPGILIHAQALRSHLGPGLLHPVPWPIQVALVALALLGVLVKGPPVHGGGDRRRGPGGLLSREPRGPRRRPGPAAARPCWPRLLAGAAVARRVRRRRRHGRAPAAACLLRRPGEPRRDARDARRQPLARA